MSEMTIAQALRYVKKLKGRIDEARKRAADHVSHAQAETPAFDFNEQLDRATKASDELAKIQGQLAAANAATVVNYGGENITLSHAVRLLQELRSRIAWVKALSVKGQTHVTELVQVMVPGQGYGHVQRPMQCHLPEASRAAMVERLQDQFDALNAAVEEKNQKVTI